MKTSKNFYLYKIWMLMGSGKTQPEIEEELKFSKQRLKYYRDFLRKIGFIDKGEGYGQWKVVKKYDENEVKKFFEEVKKTTRIGVNQLEEVKNLKEVRGHAVVVKLELPKNYRNWRNRRKIFEILGMKYEPHLIGGIERGELINFEGIKIHTYNKSIDFNFDEKDFIAETSKKSKSYALIKFLKLVKKLERKFNNSPMSQFGKYKFRITRQHYALMKNSLAKQYLNEDKKLECYTGRGLWLLIDNSFNLEELETVHPDTADEDNERVQTFFNEGIKKADIETIKETTPNKIKEKFEGQEKVINKSMQVLEGYAEQIALHLVVEKKQLHNLEEQNKLFKEIRDFLKER